MKVALGSKYIEGPYGGGNTFIKNFSSYLFGKGHKVVFDLRDNDIDIILLTNPLFDSAHSTFNHLDIDRYQSKVNKSAISIQRINECDERKQTNYVNRAIIKSNNNIDHTVFVSSWLKGVYEKSGIKLKSSSVVLGGSDSNIFNGINKVKWNGSEKISLVTHHWSDNWMKGFQTYKLIDELLENEKWSKQLNFTYIGNYPKELVFKNTKLIAPLDGKDLGNELKNHHIYITGSLNEPSGNHHVEAGLCRLPTLYINSGGVTEYCKDYGVQFENNSIEKKLIYLISNYDRYYDKLKSFNLTSEKMSEDYLSLFEDLQNSKLEILKNREAVSIASVYLKESIFFSNKIINRIFYKVKKLFKL